MSVSSYTAIVYVNVTCICAVVPNSISHTFGIVLTLTCATALFIFYITVFYWQQTFNLADESDHTPSTLEIFTIILYCNGKCSV